MKQKHSRLGYITSSLILHRLQIFFFFSMNVFSFHNPNTTFPKSTDKGNVIRCTFLVNTAELSTVGRIQGHSSQQVKYKVREVNRSV